MCNLFANLPVLKYLNLLLLLPLHSLAQHAVISATKMNVLYIGIDNPISFVVEHTNCSELTLGVENGTVKKTGDCACEIVVTNPGTAVVFILKGKDTLYKTLYRVKYIPNPVITEGSQESYWSLDSLRSQTGLLATIKHWDFDTRFAITSFDFTAFRNKKVQKNKRVYCSECFKRIKTDHFETVFTTTNEGADFNDVLKKFIQKELQPGDKVIIENIRALGPDNRVRQLPSISMLVQ